MRLIPYLCAAAITVASAAETTPQATVETWLTAVRTNNLSTVYTSLTPEQQHAWAEDWKKPAASVSGRGGRGPGGMLERPLRQLSEAEGAKTVARILVGAAIELGNTAAPAQQTPPAPAAAPAPAPGQEQNPWMAFLPRMLAGMAVSALPQRILAADLESRQIAAIQKLYESHRAWAATVKADDEQRLTAVSTQLVAVGKALKMEANTDLSAVDLPELLARASAALPPLKQALAAIGLDADAVLASAKVTTESATGDDAVLLISFTAYGVAHQIPCKLHRQADSWQIVADSPALRWLRPQGMMGGMGGPGMGGPGMRGGRGQRPGEGDAPQAPPTKPGEAAF